MVTLVVGVVEVVATIIQSGGCQWPKWGQMVVIVVVGVVEVMFGDHSW